MRTKIAVSALAAVLLAAGVIVISRQSVVRGDLADVRVSMAMNEASGWPRISRMVAGVMIEKYGAPDRVSPGRLEWGQRRPWKRTVVTDHPLSPLEQTVDYVVPEPRVAAVAAFRHGLAVDTDQDELTVRSDREEMSFLALNLAHDIARGRRTPEESDRFFLRTLDLGFAGKSSPYTEGLRFRPHDLEPYRPPFPIQ
ncbi:MAG: hypothetical protein HY924_09700 [Elusimicrobia bacterium]|nr:hypothetical protein [Elusimicrobiota bacterium]